MFWDRQYMADKPMVPFHPPKDLCLGKDGICV